MSLSLHNYSNDKAHLKFLGSHMRHPELGLVNIAGLEEGAKSKFKFTLKYTDGNEIGRAHV